MIVPFEKAEKLKYAIEISTCICTYFSGQLSGYRISSVK